MRSRSRGWGFPFVAVVLLLMAGCGINSTFVYKPGAPAASGPKLPVKVAVLPFKDGTEDFTKRGGLFAKEGYTYNLAKSDIGDLITALSDRKFLFSLSNQEGTSLRPAVVFRWPYRPARHQ